MASQIYLNLPVKDLDRSVDFFEKLGYSFNPDFTNEQGACMVVSDNICVMLLTEAFFQTFTRKPVHDATTATEAIVCLSMDSSNAVDAIVAKAVAAGARTHFDASDQGFMYGHGFEDLDGHLWEFVHMKPDAVPNC
ncbi:glyoxalase/bleomycin resistance/extradiol dioxygenase family protein [Lysobacter sp. S4-A87]|uniref:VOC family protein n=1 Tax=Lysobacter sp. S4-A87 TaxID=2925843 RepID=UPI001F539565|nr:VOC family protein [Lysobacter sp. S4-A87]UNK49270.1 glyoxalase/bleomycin resistance/extradiol dioxygenase family protein [Lysobacter sp. S4-A87]